MNKKPLDSSVAFRRSSLTRREFIKLAAVTGVGATLAACGVKAPAEETELIVGSWGGAWDDSTKKYIIDPLVKETNAKVSVVPGNSSDHYPKLIANPNNPPYDVLWLDLDYVAPLAAQNALLPISNADVPALKDVYDNLKFFNGQAVAANFGVLCLVYDTNVLPSVDSWQILWDDQVKCKFALTPLDSWAIQWLIMADRLAGGDGTNLNNGIEKTKTLAPNAKALIGDYDSRPAFERKELVVGMMYSGEAYVMWSSGQKNVAMSKPKEGGVIIPNCLVIPKNAKHPNLAKKFINYALSATGQEGFVADYASIPSSKTANVPDDKKGWMFVGDDIKSLILPDYNKILKDKDAVSQRWNAEIVPMVGKSC
jgi:putative spermidine/putrescine transport system substrate-binding protein